MTVVYATHWIISLTGLIYISLWVRSSHNFASTSLSCLFFDILEVVPTCPYYQSKFIPKAFLTTFFLIARHQQFNSNNTSALHIHFHKQTSTSENEVISFYLSQSIRSRSYPIIFSSIQKYWSNYFPKNNSSCLRNMFAWRLIGRTHLTQTGVSKNAKEIKTLFSQALGVRAVTADIVFCVPN